MEIDGPNPETQAILKLFAPTSDMTLAAKEVDVKSALMKLWFMKKGEATTKARDVGFIFGGNDGKGKRYVTFKFPEHGRKMVTLASVSGSAASTAASSSA